MKYATVDTLGTVTGHYDDEINEAMPPGALALSDSEWEHSCRGQLGWSFIVGAWVTKDPVEPSMEDLRAAKESALRAEGSLRLSALAAPYLPAERETWPTQQAEARAWSLDPAAPTPMLSAVALARGISLADLVAKVLENVALFEAASGAILGQQQALLDTLAAVDPAAPDAAALIAAVQWGSA